MNCSVSHENHDRNMLAMPLAGLLDEYVRERLVGKSPDTIRLMRTSIESFAKHLGRTAQVGDLEKNAVLKYLIRSLETKMARDTVEMRRTRLVSLWCFAFKKGWLAEGPAIPAIPTTPEQNELLAKLRSLLA